MIKELQVAGLKIGWLYAIAPENARAGYIPTDIEGIWQYGSRGGDEPLNQQDGIAPQVSIPEILDPSKENRARIPIDCSITPCGQYPSHRIKNYDWIFEKVKKEKGAIKPRN